MSSTPAAAEARAILYPYQRRWIDDQSRFKIGMFSRQTGKTYTSTLEIAEDMVKAEVEKRRVRWVILSRGERQAREAMEEGLKVHLRAYGAAFESLESDFHLADATSCKSLEVVMAHGSRVTALPANPDTARGFSANVFLDEFAFHADSRKIWAALFPVVSRNGLKLRVVSTPNGEGNKFYDLMTSAETAGWSKHVVDIYQAVADGLPRDVEALRAARVGVAGAGGLGSNAVLMLARSGVEHFLLIDDDVVDASNLNRQQFWPRHLGRPKVEALAELVRELNPDARVETCRLRIDAANVDELVARCPLWLEAMDGAADKRLLVEKVMLSGRRIASASGMGGFGGKPMQKRVLGNLVLVGDFETDILEYPPLAPRVTEAAALLADAMLEFILTGVE